MRQAPFPSSTAPLHAPRELLRIQVTCIGPGLSDMSRQLIYEVFRSNVYQDDKQRQLHLVFDASSLLSCWGP